MQNIRKAKSEDIDEIIEIYHSLIGIKGCTWDKDYPSIEDVKQDLLNEYLYVILNESKIIGVASCGKDHRLNSLKCWNKDIQNSCDLARIGVLEEYQGKGIAKELIKYIEQDVYSKGFDGIRFLVSKNNPRALNLYNSLNYKNVGDIFMYGIDWYCYEKKLA